MGSTEMIRRDEGEVLHGVGGHERGERLDIRVTLLQGPLVSAPFFVLKLEKKV